ncbi:hypothetical protein [Martelella mangrovi]|uniref:Uncharacterized protein n=1 Tax=Martelella mangrovi TaxID=1397477 RepID=A0ABV2IC27_9HYPH
MKPGMRGYVSGDLLYWGDPVEVASHLYYQANSGARCTRLNGEDWVFWKDLYSNTILYKCGTDQTWPSCSAYPFSFSSDEVPGVATYRNQVHAAYKHAGYGAIYWSVYNRGWSDAIQISGAFTSASPALAVYNNQLFLAWSTNDSTPTLSYCWFDGTNWSAPQNTRYLATGGPAMAAHNGELFFACARGNNLPIVYIRYSNDTLSTPAIIQANYISECAPALASNGEELRMTWYGYPNLHALTTAWTRNSGWSAAKQLEKVYPVCSPGMYGDFSGIRIVWVTSSPGGILTLSKAVDGCRNYWVSGKAMPDSWVTVAVTENSTTRSYATVQADGHGAWSMDFDANLNDGDRIEATASFEKYGPQSGAFVTVIGQSQDDNYVYVRNVTPTGITGIAPLPGQVIKGWRSSDGKLVVNYTVSGTSFEAPYLFPGAYIDGDTINLVSQFPDNGTMTKFSGGPAPYSYP